MKVFFDTNVYIAEALSGQAAERLLDATVKGAWRIYSSAYLLEELERVLTERLGFRRRLAVLTQKRIRRRSTLVEPPASRHVVPEDRHDSPILQAALAAKVDYLVTNDTHLLKMSPYEGLRILSMTEYHHLLVANGLLAQP
jgi:putative PIN family toxin of toxin-antitoxin system